MANKQDKRQRRWHKTGKDRHAHPHDSVFKKIFKRPAYCHALMQVVLAPSFYTLFDWTLVKISESTATGAKGQERRADIVLEVPLLHSKSRVIITIILEHKSYRDSDTILQMLGYYNAIAQQTGGVILPIIVTCCEDKKATIPSDYISWALQKQDAPEELKKRIKKITNFTCPLVNLHDLSYLRLRRGGKAVSLALFGMCNYWDMDEDIVVKILKQARLLPQQEREFMLNVLMDYYECADKGYGYKEFAKIERKRFVHLKEEERLMPEMEFGLDRARKEGMEQGLRKGMRKGKQLGIEQGVEKGLVDVALRLLEKGIGVEEICEITKLSRSKITKLKSGLDRN